ncbi:YeeE/YedE family protein, partial [Vibrio sp. 10N.286.49.E1]
GCTSGHGIVGMARLSKRSIVATCVFMGVAIVTVFIKNLIGLGA